MVNNIGKQILAADDIIKSRYDSFIIYNYIKLYKHEQK